MLYKSLQTSNLENQAESVDANNVVIYNLDATENFETEIVDGFNNIEYLVIPNSIVGAGTLKYYQSLDKINWNVVTLDDNVTEVEFSISSDTIETLKDFRIIAGYRKLVWTAGTTSAGTLTIKVYNE